MGKFYDRQKELAALAKIEEQSEKKATFTVITGRRRIGKTFLLREFIHTKDSCYLFTSRSSEPMLCQKWQEELESSIGLKIFGKITRLSDLFREIMSYAKVKHFILVIDEFQDLQGVNPAFFSQMQDIWDSFKDEAKINLIVCGSLYSLMVKIFENSKEPLFGRATAKINLEPFSPLVLKQILGDYNPAFTPEDLLCLFMLTGGVAKYIFLLLDSGCTTRDSMIEFATGITSPFLTDGKELLVNEMGKDYGIYFSVLSLIAKGMTTQSEIDSIIEKNTGSYLANLHEIYSVIKPTRPLFAKEGSRNARWQITDPYLRFYFRFIYSNQNLIELGQHALLKKLIQRDYETVSGKALEEYFLGMIKDEQEVSLLGGWWDRKSQNEIDVIAINEMEKTCCIYEVKRKKEKIDLGILEKKAVAFQKNIPGYRISLGGLSMEDM